MRTTLVPSMLAAISRNHKKGNLSGRLFEVGNRFIAKSLPLTEYPDERETLCIAAFGDDEDFYSLKGMVDKVAETLHVDFVYEADKKSFLHPYQTATVKCDGEVVGYLGKVAYEVAEKYDLRTAAFIAELDLKLLTKYYSNTPSFKPVSKFADETRDLALVMDKDITCGQVEEVIKKACKAITDITLFDVYEGSQIPADKKSMAFKITFAAGENGFEEGAVDKYVKKILGNLKFNLQIELRG